jgi:DUF971 family protein
MSDPVQPRHWPKELRLHKDRSSLTVSFENGEHFELSAEYLRVESPSAEVQGHNPSERKILGGKRNVQIMEIHPVGNYAVRLVFDDMHSTGIFSWDYFYQLGREHEQRFARYEEELMAKGLTREPKKK